MFFTFCFAKEMSKFVFSQILQNHQNLFFCYFQKSQKCKIRQKYKNGIFYRNVFRVYTGIAQLRSERLLVHPVDVALVGADKHVGRLRFFEIWILVM